MQVQECKEVLGAVSSNKDPPRGSLAKVPTTIVEASAVEHRAMVVNHSLAPQSKETTTIEAEMAATSKSVKVTKHNTLLLGSSKVSSGLECNNLKVGGPGAWSSRLSRSSR